MSPIGLSRSSSSSSSSSEAANDRRSSDHNVHGLGQSSFPPSQRFPKHDMTTNPSTHPLQERSHPQYPSLENDVRGFPPHRFPIRDLNTDTRTHALRGVGHQQYPNLNHPQQSPFAQQDASLHPAFHQRPHKLHRHHHHPPGAPHPGFHPRDFPPAAFAHTRRLTAGGSYHVPPPPPHGAALGHAWTFGGRPAHRPPHMHGRFRHGGVPARHF